MDEKHINTLASKLSRYQVQQLTGRLLQKTRLRSVTLTVVVSVRMFRIPSDGTLFAAMLPLF